MVSGLSSALFVFVPFVGNFFVPSKRCFFYFLDISWLFSSHLQLIADSECLCVRVCAPVCVHMQACVHTCMCTCFGNFKDLQTSSLVNRSKSYIHGEKHFNH